MVIELIQTYEKCSSVTRDLNHDGTRPYWYHGTSVVLEPARLGTRRIKKWKIIILDGCWFVTNRIRVDSGSYHGARMLPGLFTLSGTMLAPCLVNHFVWLFLNRSEIIPAWSRAITCRYKHGTRYQVGTTGGGSLYYQSNRVSFNSSRWAERHAAY